jgi:hypothetical protein
MIGVDAIPYEVALKLTDPKLGSKAIFTNLRGPSAVINTFPSSSYVAWSGLLEPFGIKKSLGYEARYFDHHLHKVTGGLSLQKVPAPWKDFFNWKLEGVVHKAIAYAWPKTYSLGELDEGLAEFLASNEPFFKMYIVSTDGLGHVYGPAALGEFLVSMDQRLQQFSRDHPKLKFHTVIFSDHGMAGGTFLRNTWPQVEEAVEVAGFEVTESQNGPKDVVIISFGLLTSFVAYTSPGQEQRVAEIFAAVPGVDLCVIEQAGGWRVLSARGDAMIRVQSYGSERRWSYEPVGGDPLDYAPVIRQLRQRAQESNQTLFPDAWWFEASKDRTYPDALYRLGYSFQLASNPASILCSISPGYMFGARKTEYITLPTVGRLKWSHGALHREASLGFLMTDIPNWELPDAVRFNAALEFIARLTEPHFDYAEKP